MTSMSPRLISLDTESYGSITHTHTGTPLPRQNHFHPLRCLAQDNPPRPEYLAHTVTITTILHGRDPGDITQWQPGTTQILHPYIPQHRAILTAWLRHATTILGTNIPYDIKMLWTAYPEVQQVLSRLTTRLVDVTILNYLHSELRPEKSLKSLGPLLGTHRYDRTLKSDGRFPSPSDPAHEDYAAQDSHNNVLAACALARGITRDHPNSTKLTPYSQQFYSNTLWTCIEMSHSGVPFVKSKLQDLHNTTTTRAHLLDTQLAAHALDSTSPNPKIRKTTFLNSCIDRLLQHTPGAMDRLELTDKTKEVRFSNANRAILRTSLPPDDPAQPALTLYDEFSYADKLLGTYTHKRLYHKRNDPTNTRDVLLPHVSFPDTLMAYPSWYPTPSPEKDGGGDEGGTKQARITCKYPTLQTDPPELQACLQPLISCDLSQIELRVPGILSGEPAMLRAYNDNVDLHYERGDSMSTILRSYNYDLYVELQTKLGDKFRKTFRQGGKGINFADLFWSSAPTMQAQVAGLMGVVLPLDFFEKIADNRRHDRPVLYAWQESLVREACSTNKLTLPLIGQSRYFWPKSKKGRRTQWPTNEIVNFPVQATAGNVMLDLQSRVQHRFLTEKLPYRICLNIYDAFYIRHLLRPTFTTLESARITTIINDGLTDCMTIGYWHDLQTHYGRTLPLVAEIKVPPQ